MASRAAARAPGRIYELGEQGRKTGVTLPNTGAPDEHGLQPIDGLFSSPRKAETPRADQTGELDMELESSGPGPSTILAAQRSARLQIPRGRSPAKTNLQSPAVKNPHLGLNSSPSRGSIMRARDADDDSDDHTVTRRLDLRKTHLNGARARRSNGARRVSSPRLMVQEEDEEDEDEVLRVDAGSPGFEDSMQLVDDSPSPPDMNVEEYEEEEEARPKPGRRGRPRGRPAAKKAPPAPRESSEELASEPEVEHEEEMEEEEEVDPEEPEEDSEEPEQEEEDVLAPPPRKRGRPPKKAAPVKATATSSKRRERATTEVDDQEPEARGKKRQKTQAKPAPAPAPAPAATKKRRGRPPKAKPQAQLQDEDPDASLLQARPGPPLPKARGLVSMRRDEGIAQTRSGRRSYKPLEFWKGERVEYETGDAAREDMFRAGSRMVLPSVREVIRVDDVEEQTRKRNPRGRGRPKGTTKKRAAAADDEDDEEEPEEWEREPGVISGDVVLWEPDHEINPPGAEDHVEVVEDQLAVSSDAILTRDIHDATFRFAKTLNLSFMGSGVVDLPAGAEKKPKNSRKMQMVFFVFYGKVLVSVNETEFRISAGGQWFVPRGNYYSIKNDSDRPARLFFAQACEVSSDFAEE